MNELIVSAASGPVDNEINTFAFAEPVIEDIAQHHGICVYGFNNVGRCEPTITLTKALIPGCTVSRVKISGNGDI